MRIQNNKLSYSESFKLLQIKIYVSSEVITWLGKRIKSFPSVFAYIIYWKSLVGSVTSSQN